MANQIALLASNQIGASWPRCNMNDILDFMNQYYCKESNCEQEALDTSTALHGRYACDGGIGTYSPLGFALCER